MTDGLKKSILLAVPDISLVGDGFSFPEALFDIDTSVSYNGCRKQFEAKRYDFLFIDVSLLSTDNNGVSPESFKPAIASFHDIFPTADIIVMASKPHIRDAVYAVKAGASDYLTYPVNPSELSLIIERIDEKNRELNELDYLRKHLSETDDAIVSDFSSPLMQSVYSQIRSVSDTRTTVLLQGETGTGKNVIAETIHQYSSRKSRQFISVHCGAIPDTLIESELFGHEKGAFTGAFKRKMGKFEIAHRGTIFLDEIGTITAPVQIKLLQVLQDRTFNRVGGEALIHSDIRIIAATNDTVEDLVARGGFRKDLYYRLNVFPIFIPPLRERKEDIPILVKSFIARLNREYSKNIHGIHPRVFDAFLNYDWPGNIRELENLIERAYILETSSELTPESFPGELFSSGVGLIRQPLPSSQTLKSIRTQAIELIESQYLKDVLATHKGKINTSAKTAGISSRQLHKLMTRYGINKNDFK